MCYRCLQHEWTVKPHCSFHQCNGCQSFRENSVAAIWTFINYKASSRARVRALSLITFCISFVSLFSKDWLLKAANRGFWGFFVGANCSEPSFTKYIVPPVISCLLWNNAFWFFQNISMQWWWWKVGPFKLLKGCWVIDSTEKWCSCIQPWALTSVSLNSLMWRHKSLNHLLHTQWRLVESPVMLM